MRDNGVIIVHMVMLRRPLRTETSSRANSSKEIVKAVVFICGRKGLTSVFRVIFSKTCSKRRE